MRTEGVITLCCWKAGCGESRLSGLVGGSRKRASDGTSPACLPNGDIKGCFDHISHEILLDTIRACIHDERFIRLISNMLKAGYVEEWTYHQTYSGTPQGGVVSPILSNIYMHKLDEYITRQLMPKWTQGTKRKRNNEYSKLILRASRLRREGKKPEAERYLKQAIKMPSVDTQDKGYRRLKYIRYADDFLIGFIGPKEEAEQVKEEIREFLQGELKLELSADKTLVTHARTKAAQFLGYEVQVLQDDSQRQRNRQRRTLNANIGLRIPERVAREKCQQYMVGGKVVHRPELLLESDYAIIDRYQVVYRGVVNYYRMAHNLHRLRGLKWRMEQSLTKTLANKYQKSVREIYRKYTARVMKDGRTYKALQVVVPRQDKEPLVATWGGIPLEWSPAAEAKDQIVKPKFGRTEIVQRLLANQCEYCGSMESIEVHHIRAMKDLKKHTGKERPLWVQLMAARRRKTMVLCRICHQDITYGRPMRNKPSGTGFMQGQKE